jgi:hypothetical protein
MHVNLIKPEHSHIPDEIEFLEFLLASYSVFTVWQSPDAFGCQKTWPQQSSDGQAASSADHK